MPLFILFLCVPLIEIMLFVAVGDEIGIVATLALCILTAIAGAVLIQAQGMATLKAAQDAIEKRQMPVQEIFDGFCLLIAGLVLLTPGFFTDTIGFLLLTPPFRTWLRGQINPHINARTFRANSAPNDNHHQKERVDKGVNVIEGEYERVDNESKDDNS